MAHRASPWVALSLSGLLWSGHAVCAGNLPDIIDRVRPSVVGVGTITPTRRPPSRLTATGFAVGDGRHVITNAHALPRSLDTARNEVLAIFSGRGNTSRGIEVSVVGQDSVHDLALLKLASGRLPALRFGSSAAVREGQLHAFTGFPIGAVLGLYPTTHRGIIAAITPIAIPQLASRFLDSSIVNHLREPYDVFQLDATAYPGNSGSPLYSASTGEVIGIINKVFIKQSRENVLSTPSGITFAIPAEHARALLSKHGIAN